MIIFLRLFHLEKRNVPNIPSLGVFHFESTRRTEPLKTGVSFHLTFLVSTVSLIDVVVSLFTFHFCE